LRVGRAAAGGVSLPAAAVAGVAGVDGAGRRGRAARAIAAGAVGFAFATTERICGCGSSSGSGATSGIGAVTGAVTGAATGAGVVFAGGWMMAVGAWGAGVVAAAWAVDPPRIGN